MGRPIRIEYAGALYHVTSRGNERKEIFLDDGDRIKFLEIFEDYHDRYGILVHAYVVMDNHYHVILETPKGNLLKVMHGVNGSYTGYFNRKYGRVGHLFQGRYKGIIVEKETYLIPLSRYVHLNPVRAGVVERPEQYQWSSYRGYIGKVKEETWVEYSWVLSGFGRDKMRARKKYKEYTEEGLGRGMESPLKKLPGQVILGGEKFIEEMRKLVSKRRLSHEIVERKRFMEYPRIEKVVEAVAESFGVNGETILEKSGKGNKARRAALYLSQRHTGLSNGEIARYFEGIQSSAVSKASSRLKEEMVSDKKLSRLIEKLESIFKA